MNSYVQPNLAESLSILTATTQIICNILIAKKVITREEYDEFFSNENIEEMEDMLLKEALKNLKENK